MSVSWIKASIASAVAQLTKMACGLAILKIVITQLGVEGVGKLGQFMSLLSILYVFAGGGVNAGIAKYVAEYQHSPQKLAGFLSAAWSYSIIASGVLAIVFVAGAWPASVVLFGDSRYKDLIVFVGLAQFAFAYVNFATGVINGLRKTQIYSRVMILGSLIGIAPAYWLVRSYGLQGAVIALVLMQAGLLIPAARELPKLINAKFSLAVRSIEPQRLARFSAMQLFSVATMPLAEMFIRTRLMSISGWGGAGTWQGVQRLSYASLSLISSFLAVYYMPSISASTTKSKVVRQVSKTLIVAMGGFGVGACMEYVLRSYVFALFLSRDFAIPPELFRLQLIGDFLRVGSYVIAFLAVAKAATRLFIICEIVQASLYAIAFVVISAGVGGRGVFYAYAASNLGYFLICLAGFLVYARTTSVEVK